MLLPEVERAKAKRRLKVTLIVIGSLISLWLLLIVFGVLGVEGY
jgi:hypothetical protein